MVIRINQQLLLHYYDGEENWQKYLQFSDFT